MEDRTYQRVLIKISGEQFAGESDSVIDINFVNWVADEIAKAAETGAQIAVLAGGGNIIRGRDFAHQGVERATADYMGMLSGVMNGQMLMDVLQSKGVNTRIMSSIQMEQIAESFIRRKAIRHMEKGRVLIIVGGMGKPFFSHDTAGVTFALELGCDIFMKSTKVDGVYDKDPRDNPDAQKLDEVTFQFALEHPEIGIMDKSALGLAMEQNMPVRIFKLEENSFRRVVSGEKIGTEITK